MGRLEQVEASARGELLVKLLEDERFAGILGEVWRISEARVVAGCERLRAVGYPARQVKQLERIASSQAKRLEAAAKWRHADVIQGGSRAAEREEGPVLVEEVLHGLLRDQGLPAGLVVPVGWELRPWGVFRVVKDEYGEPHPRQIADAPMLITGRLHDSRTGKAQLQVSWYHQDRAGSRWIAQIVQRSTVADARGVVALADGHAPVNSGNGRDVVAWLAAFEAANRETLPVAASTSALGWQADGSFLLGCRLIQGGVVTTLDPTAPAAAWTEGQVQLQEDEYLAQLAGGYVLAGTWEGWRAAHALVADKPSVQVALYASLISPLLHLLPEIPNHALDWSAPTSEGKTSGLRLAASVWGVPNEDAEDGRTVLHTWTKKTSVWIENACVRRPGLPLILDDTKKARSAEIVQQTLYEVEGGQGGGRGMRDGGARALKSYRTILLTTGEYPITTIGRVAHGGAVARVIELCGSPLGGANRDNGRLAKLLKMDLLQHHGHAGERLIRWLTAEPRREALLADYRHYLLHWERLAGDDKIAGRAADYMAALSLGRDLAVRVLGLPDCPGALGLAWEAVLRNTHRADVAWTAMQGTLSWVGAQRHRFAGSSAARQQPSQGLLGVWDDAAGWAELGIYPHELRGFLEGQGFEAPLALLRAWADKGWIRTSAGHMTERMRFGASRERLVVVLRTAWDAVMGVDQDQEGSREAPF